MTSTSTSRLTGMLADGNVICPFIETLPILYSFNMSSLLMDCAVQTKMQQIIYMRSCQAFYGIGGAVVDFDFSGILQNHAPRKNNMIAEAAIGLIIGFRGKQRRLRHANDPAGIGKIQQ